jgi:hypothetical protein
MESEVTPGEQAYRDEYDRRMADGIDVLWKRHDDLVAYERLLRDLSSDLGTEEDRTEGDDDTHYTVHYADLTIEQLREDISFIQAECDRVEKERAALDQELRILDRVLGGRPSRPRDVLLESLKELWWE